MFALAGAVALVRASPMMLLVAAVCVQLRLLCNLLDGMVAIEGGKQSAVGALYNEFPDRIADSLLLVALGYAAGVPWLGWLAALLAALTAYVRATGGALGFAQDFRGPMAKPQRMAVLTIACVVGAAELHVERHALRAHNRRDPDRRGLRGDLRDAHARDRETPARTALSWPQAGPAFAARTLATEISSNPAAPDVLQRPSARPASGGSCRSR